MKLNYPNYKKLNETFLLSCEKLKQEYISYVSCLDMLVKNGVKSGRLHNELSGYISYVGNVPDLIDAISLKMKAFITSYLSDMNQAQNFEGEYILYEEHYAGTRDYTDENFLQMRIDCDTIDADANIFEKIDDWAVDLVSKAFNYIGKTFFLWSARDTRYFVMEINDITKAQLADIQTKLHTQEMYYHSNAIDLLLCISQLKAYIATLNSAVTCDVESFSIKPFIVELDYLFKDITETLDKIYVDNGISWKAIDAFIKTDNVESYFDKYKVIITNFLTDMSDLELNDMEFWKITISQLFDVALNEMMGWVRKLFGDDYDYNTYLYDNEMMKLFDEMAKTKTFEDTEYDEVLSDYKEFMGLIKKYGDDWEKYLTTHRDQNGDLFLDKRTKNYKYFKEFFKHFKNAENIMKYGTDVIEILAAYTTEYEKNLEILNVIIDDCEPGSEMAKSLERIKLRYESSWENAASLCKDKLVEYGDDAVKKLLESKKLEGELFKFANVFKVVGWVELAIDVTSEVTGIGEETQAKLQLLSLGWEQIDSAENAYVNALKKVKSCSPDSEEYVQSLKDFSVSFEYYRLSLKRLFDKMAKAASGDKQEYYRYCAEHIDDLNIENHEVFELKSYEEYIAA